MTRLKVTELKSDHIHKLWSGGQTTIRSSTVHRSEGHSQFYNFKCLRHFCTPSPERRDRVKIKSSRTSHVLHLPVIARARLDRIERRLVLPHDHQAEASTRASTRVAASVGSSSTRCARSAGVTPTLPAWRTAAARVPRTVARICTEHDEDDDGRARMTTPTTTLIGFDSGSSPLRPNCPPPPA